MFINDCYRFLRSNKPWDPPADIEVTILKICADNGLKSESEFEGLDVKFKVLNACFNETGYSVPNSLLHTIECVGKLMLIFLSIYILSEVYVKRSITNNVECT